LRNIAVKIVNLNQFFVPQVRSLTTFSNVMRNIATVEEDFSEVPEVLKSGLQGSWLAKFFTKPDQIIIKSQDPEMVQFKTRWKLIRSSESTVIRSNARAKET